jgi:predicted phage terminase large subunit-like protein
METETINPTTKYKRTKHNKGEKNILLLKALSDPHSTLRALIKNRFYYCLQYFWSEYSQDEFVPNWHIVYLCNELEIVARRVAENKPKLYDLIINIPPGSSKTAIVSIFFPIWCWINWFHFRFITASYTAPLALESAEYSRDVIKSEKFQVLFPEIGVKADKDTKSNFRVVKREFASKGRSPRIHTGGNRLSTSVGGTATGFHGHINIWDDPIDPNRAVSEAEVKKANHWMTNTLPFRKVNKEVTATIGIMQRLHQNDPTAHLLEKDEGRGTIKHICLPGEIKNYKDQVKPAELIKHYKNNLMDVNRLNWSVLNDYMNLGQFTYGGQIGQDPVPLGGGMFKTDHISTVDRIPEKIYIAETVRYWDKAGTKDAGAYTVGVKMLKLKDGRFIVSDVKRGQWASNEREKIIKETAQADGVDCKVYVEQEPGSGGKESAEATVANLSGFSVYKDRPVGDKTQRADPYSVQVNEGNVMIFNAGWNKDYLDELKNFPNSTFKDQTDASSGGFSKLTGLKKVAVLRR